MKSKTVKIVFVAIIAIASGFKMFSTQKSSELSDIALANIEALAKEGIEIPYYCAGTGYCAIDGEAFDGTKYSWQ